MIEMLMCEFVNSLALTLPLVCWFANWKLIEDWLDHSRN